MITNYKSCFNISDEIELEQKAFDLGKVAYKEKRRCDPKNDYDKLYELTPNVTTKEMAGLMNAWRKGWKAAEVAEGSD